MMATKKKTKRTWQPTIGAKLGPQEQRLRDAVARPTGPHLAIHLAPEVLGFNVSKIAKLGRRRVQQRIGAIAARHNRKVKSPHIVRGDTPGTYRLKRVR